MAAPRTEVEYHYDSRFRMPSPPRFGAWGAIASIISLLVMTLASTLMLAQLLGSSAMAPWTWIPFAFTIFGAGLGALFELYLLFAGTPYEQSRSSATTLVFRIRRLNLGPVTASTLFFVACMLVHDPALRLAMLLGCGALGVGLGIVLFFGVAKAVPKVLLGIQAVTAIMVLAADVPLGGWPVKLLLLAQPILQTVALSIGTATPLRSTGFHLIATVSGVMLYRALLVQAAVAPDFFHAVAVELPVGSLRLWAFVAACMAAVPFVARVSPRTYAAWRTAASNAVWPAIYFALVSSPRFPKPLHLGRVYAGKPTPAPTRLRPYSVQHPKFLSVPASIPAVETLAPNVLALTEVFAKAKRLFALVALVDRYFPQTNSKLPLADKPRLEPWSSGRECWPNLFRKRLFGRTMPAPEPTPAPPAAIAAHAIGQQLAWLCESSIGTTLLERGRSEGELMLDLRFLEKYETKPDYEPYGGQAFFVVDAMAERLVLRSVIAPRTTHEIMADPHDPSFRRAEAMIIASLYHQVVTGKHLAEIHMTYNLVEVALRNAFDAQDRWNHPFRLIMYIHTFSHEFAEELTTQHLVQDGAVFAQIFATTHAAMIQHLDDSHRAFEYGKDEEFEARAAMLGMLPNAAINWELEYVKIWTRYADALIDIVYPDDAAVSADRHLQDFRLELSALLAKPLAPRYANFASKAGVSRFLSDTIHHLVVRHQVYGTTAVPGLDARLATTQVPRDGGTPGVDEWRSLIGVALATAHARFVPMLEDFKYLLDGIDPRYEGRMREVFDALQADLRVLDAEWTASEASRAHNRNYFRALPSELRTGPGY